MGSHTAIGVTADSTFAFPRKVPGAPGSTNLYGVGRDTIITPLENVQEKIENGSTGLAEANKIYRDGTLRLDWTQTEFWKL